MTTNLSVYDKEWTSKLSTTFGCTKKIRETLTLKMSKLGRNVGGGEVKLLFWSNVS